MVLHGATLKTSYCATHVIALVLHVMGSTNLTVRMDEALRKEIEAAAAVEDRSVTDFLIRAAKARMAAQCPTCGRSDVPGSIPPAFTPAFDAFLVDAKKQENRWIPFLITTNELGQPRVYRGVLNPRDEDDRGVVPLMFEVPIRTKVGAGSGRVVYQIPRGVITGWKYDQEGTAARQLVALGYVDGNMLLALAGLEGSLVK